MRRLLDWFAGIAEALGGPGLFLLAFLDSSFLSFPQIVDVLIMGLCARYPERVLWYAALPTAGSILGSYILYTMARRGGETFLRKRLHERHVERAFRVVRKYGLFAVAIPAILPPPVPLKLFVLGAGAAGVKRMDFIVAIAIGRGIRYFGEGLLAAWYGPAAMQFLQDHARGFTIGALVLIVGGSAVWLWWSRRPRRV